MGQIEENLTSSNTTMNLPFVSNDNHFNISLKHQIEEIEENFRKQIEQLTHRLHRLGTIHILC